MAGNKKRRLKNYRIIFRCSADFIKYVRDLCEKKGKTMSEDLIESYYKANQSLILPKGSIYEKYQIAKALEYEAAMYDVVITSDMTKATWEYNAMRLVKKAIEKQSDPTNLKNLVKSLFLKAKFVYKDDKMATTFTRLQTYLSDRFIYTTLRARVKQTTEDRMRYLINKIIDDVNNRERK